MAQNRHRGGMFRVSAWLPAAVALTFLVFLKLDPFGLHSASEVRSQQASLRIVSPFYSPSRQVVVILIDDEALRERQTGWPLRFAEQGRLLRQIASVEPAVVLVDLVYPHRHGDARSSGNDEIEALTKPIAGTRVPIIFTALAREGGAGSPQSPGGSEEKEGGSEKGADCSPSASFSSSASSSSSSSSSASSSA